MKQLEPNTLRTFHDVRIYRQFSQVALPNRAVLTQLGTFVPVDSPQKGEKRTKGPVKKLYSAVASNCSVARIKLLDARTKGADSLIKDFHLIALCNSIQNDENITLVSPKDITTRQAREELIETLTARYTAAKKRTSYVASCAPIVDFLNALTPPGTEYGLAIFVAGHELQMFKTLKDALSKLEDYDLNKITLIVDPIFSEFEAIVATGSESEALNFLDDSDGIKGNGKFTPDKVGIAEALLANSRFTT